MVAPLNILYIWVLIILVGGRTQGQENPLKLRWVMDSESEYSVK